MVCAQDYIACLHGALSKHNLSTIGTETTPMPVNFNGVFSHLRFKTDANPADKITKVLVRN